MHDQLAVGLGQRRLPGRGGDLGEAVDGPLKSPPKTERWKTNASSVTRGKLR